LTPAALAAGSSHNLGVNFFFMAGIWRKKAGDVLRNCVAHFNHDVAEEELQLFPTTHHCRGLSWTYSLVIAEHATILQKVLRAALTKRGAGKKTLRLEVLQRGNPIFSHVVVSGKKQWLQELVELLSRHGVRSVEKVEEDRDKLKDYFLSR
jgi:hypothetical protein